MTQRDEVESLHFPRRAEESGTFDAIDSLVHSLPRSLEASLHVVALTKFSGLAYVDSHARRKRICEFQQRGIITYRERATVRATS